MGEKQSPEVSGQIALSLPDKGSFTDAETQIATLILVAKVKAGVIARLIHAVDSDAKAGLRNLVIANEAANITEANTLRTIANSLGISRERFAEISNYVYENEDRF